MVSPRNSHAATELASTNASGSTVAHQELPFINLSEYTEHVVDNSPSFIVALLPDGTTLEINKAGCAIVGLPRAQIIGRNLWELIYPGDKAAQVAEMFRLFERDGCVKNYEATCETTSGEQRRISWTSVNQCDDDGNLQKIIGIGVDITTIERQKSEMLASERRLAEAQRLAHIGSWELDLTSDSYWWSTEAQQIFELDDASEISCYNEFIARVHPDDREEVQNKYRDSITAPNQYYDLVHRLIFPGDRIKYVHSRCEHVWENDEIVERSLGTIQDVTNNVRQEERIRTSLAETQRLKEYTDHVVQNSPSFIVAIAPDGKTIEINDAGCRTMGWKREEIIGQDLWKKMCPGEHYAQVERLFELFQSQGEVRNFEMTCPSASGNTCILSWTSVNRRDENGDLLEVIGIGEDITDLKAYQTQLEFEAHYDALTALPNRILFRTRLQFALDRCADSSNPGALMFIDLDRFKDINDSLGHSAGDHLLGEVARRLRDCVRMEDTVARLGGDEFTLLLEEIGTIDTASSIAEKIIAEFSEVFEIEGQELRITPSIGICFFPEHGRDIDSLLRNADAALYEAKAEGGNGFAVYRRAMTDQVTERVKIATDLRIAIDRDELIVHYQPQIDLTTNEIIGAEALIRWEHPTDGLISPDKFIPIAEENGMILPIGEWVLRRACEALCAWQNDGLHLSRVSVNVAGAQLRRGDMLSAVQTALRDFELSPDRLELEVTEGFIMNHAEEGIAVLDELRKLGVALAIDDFGTGYSSLSYLKRLPIGLLKIDQSFIREIPHASDDVAIAKAVIALGRSLQLDVLAEGIETPGQRQFLIDNGCHLGQGYLISRPVPEKTFLHWAREYQSTKNLDVAGE